MNEETKKEVEIVIDHFHREITRLVNRLFEIKFKKEKGDDS